MSQPMMQYNFLAPGINVPIEDKSNLYLGYFRQQGLRAGREILRTDTIHESDLRLSKSQLAMKLPSSVKEQRS